MPPFTLHVKNRIDAIAPATARAAAWLAERQVSADASYFASLAIEELVTNCIKYGYGDRGDHVVQITLVVEDSTLRMEVVDDGRAFNPLEEAPVPDLSLPIEQRPIGGLGVHLLKELADAVDYERRDGTNRLMLTKRF